MTIYRVDVSLVAAHHIGAHIWPPDGKDPGDEDAEMFFFAPSLNGARALNVAEVSLLQRCRIELMQNPARPLHSAGIHRNLMIVSTEFAAMAEEMAPGRHQFVPLSDVWFQKAKEPSPGRYLAALVMDYAPTVDLEKSRIMRQFLPHLQKTAVRLSAIYPVQRVVRTDTALGRSLWADEATGAIFCTEDFRKRAKALDGTLGLSFGECTEI